MTEDYALVNSAFDHNLFSVFSSYLITYRNNIHMTLNNLKNFGFRR